MADFSAFRRSEWGVDRAVMHALWEIDTRSLAVALLTLAPADRDIFLRNMSVRAVDLLQAEIVELERLRPGTYDASSAAAQEALLRKITRFRALVAENEELTPSEPPRLRWDSEEELIRSLVGLKRYADRHGCASVEPLLGGDLHPLLRKGLRLYVDGWDPAVVQSLLEQMRESMAAWYRNMLDIMVEGVTALFGHDLPQVVGEKLAAFRLSDPGHEPRRGS